RFFTPTGEELASCPAPGIARAPVFARDLELLVWIDRQGTLFSLSSRQLGGERPLAPASAIPDATLEVEVNLRPTFAVARTEQGSSEVWLSNASPEGGVDFQRTTLGETRGRQPWRWRLRALPGIGEVRGFAVGIGSKRR